MNKIIQLKAPTHVELTITERCNHRCSHCYNPYRQDGAHNETITKEQVQFILSELNRCGVGYVTLTGGEPLIEPDILFYIIKQLRINNIGVGLNTNMTLMSDSILCRLRDSGFDNTILTSLPGFTPDMCDSITHISGSFQRIVDGIRLTRQKGFQVCINVVMTHKNLNNGDALLAFLKNNPVDSVAITKVVPPCYASDLDEYVFTHEDVNSMLALMQCIRDQIGCRVTSLCAIPWCVSDNNDILADLSTKCAAGIVACSIDAITGCVTPCAHNETSYGNIYKQPLEDIWHNMQSFRQVSSLPKACQSCDKLYLCGGECRLTSKRISAPRYTLTSLIDSATIKDVPQSEKPNFRSDQHLTMNRFVRLRQEEFGGTIINGQNELYVKDGLFRLVQMIQKKESLSLNELSEYVEMNEAVFQIINSLIDAGIFDIR